MLASLRCTAQINSSIWGLSIGSSTKQQVRSVINQKGFSIETEPDGAYCIKYPKGVKLLLLNPNEYYKFRNSCSH